MEEMDRRGLFAAFSALAAAAAAGGAARAQTPKQGRMTNNCRNRG
jgi:hypothetical protein